MNNTAPGAVAASRTHPAIIVAAIALTIFALVGVAALTGYLPIAKSFTSPMNVASPAQQQGSVPGDSLSAQYGGGSTESAAPAEPPPAKPAEPAAAPQAPAPQAAQLPAPKPAPKPAPAPKTVVAKAPPAPPPAPPASYSQPGPSTPNYSETNPRAAVAANTPEPVAPPPPKICRNCGTVSEIVPIEKKGESSGAGAVLGGIVGGVLGHQIGSGRGNTAATVAGAAGGALLGNQVEKNKSTIVSWEVRVRFEDGTNQVVHYSTQPTFRVGDRVKVEDGRLLARN